MRNVFSFLCGVLLNPVKIVILKLNKEISVVDNYGGKKKFCFRIDKS